MSEKNKTSNNGIFPNDGTYIGAKKGKALREEKLKKEFNEAWKSQKTLLNVSSTELKEGRR